MYDRTYDAYFVSHYVPYLTFLFFFFFHRFNRTNLYVFKQYLHREDVDSV